jgi:lipoteichoic acid synthase
LEAPEFLLPRRTARWWQFNRRALLLETGPALFFLAALVAKSLYFVLIVYPPFADWIRPRAWAERVSLAGLCSLGALLIAVSPLFLVPPRRRLVWLWAGSLVLTLIILADVLHYRYFGDILSVSAAAAGRQVGTISQSIIGLLQPADIFFFADLLLALLLLPWYSRHLAAPRPGYSPPVPLAALSLVAGLLLSALPVSIVRGAGPTNFYAFFKIRGAAKIGVLNYHLLDIVRHVSFRARAQDLPVGERTRICSFLTDRWSVADARSDLFGVAAGKNVILVMAEGLQNFVLDLRVNGQEITPHLNALARRSLTFENFYNQTWRGVTADGEFTSLQSLHPLPDGAVPVLRTSNRFRALPHVLGEHGYTTLSAHGATGAIWAMRDIHPRYGFTQSYFQEELRDGERIGMGLSDGELFRQAAPLLEALPEPFMAYLVTLTSHHPYGLPQQYRDLDLGQLHDTRLGQYLESVHYLDNVLGAAIQRLSLKGLLDRSLLVVYGDHPASLGDQRDLDTLLSRYAEHPQRVPGFDQRYWRAEQGIAFLIHLPNDAGAGRRTVAGGHLDIAPTVLHLLGIDDLGMVTFGRDLTAAESSFVVFRDGSFLTGDTLCVRESAQRSSTQCRDTRTGQSLAPTRYRQRFEAARQQLEFSDLILFNDLIPWASATQWQRRGRARPDSGSLATVDAPTCPTPAGAAAPAGTRE